MTRIRRMLAPVLGTAALGGAIAASLLTSIAPALALTPEEIAQKLNHVPVFALFDTEQESYPSATFEVEGETVSLVLSYVDRVDAEQILAAQRKNNNQIGEQITVRPIRLSQVFLEIHNRQQKGEEPLFHLIPDDTEVDVASKMRTEQTEAWRGVPLFYTPNLGITQTAPDGESRKVMPMFFSRADLDNYVAQAKKSDPKLASETIGLKVTSLENVINTLLNNSDPALSQVEFMPSRASMEYVIQEQRRNANSAPAPQQ